MPAPGEAHLMGAASTEPESIPDYLLQDAHDGSGAHGTPASALLAQRRPGGGGGWSSCPPTFPIGSTLAVCTVPPWLG
jgi:hypothetical protein